MKPEWQTKTLGEVLRLEYGKPLPASDRQPDGAYPVYGANGEKNRTNKCYVDRPSIIVGRKGSAGQVTLTEDRFWPLDVTYFVTFDEGKYDLRFLFHLLDFLDLPRLAKGVKPGINRNEVYSLTGCFPSLAEQQRVVGILDDAFEAIAAAKAAAERNRQNAKALFDSHLASVFSQRGEGWVETNIGECARFIDYRGRTPTKTASGLRLITAKNVKMGHLQDEPREFVSPEIYDEWMTRGIPASGDTLFTTEAPLANVAQLDTDEKVVFAQRIIILHPDAELLYNTFFKYLMLSAPVQQQIHELGTGATVKGIKASLLRTVGVSFPGSLIEQRRLADLFDDLTGSVEDLETLYQQKTDALHALKQSLLQDAFSGVL